MSTSELDQQFATLARKLADALIKYARERTDDYKKNIAQLNTELCALRRKENADG